MFGAPMCVPLPPTLLRSALRPGDRGLHVGEIERAEQRIAVRVAARPERISYPEELPVSSRREDIRKAIEAHQVVIVCGETGSGKTTQLPKICLEAGRGVAGLIGHTQPRRIAARTVAARIAEKLGLAHPISPATAMLMGVVPPAGKGLISLTAREGQLSCAAAGGQATASAASAIAQRELSVDNSDRLEFMAGFLSKDEG